jgi:hypothetical protein
LHFGFFPNKESDANKLKPGSLQPAHTLEERQWHDLVVPLLYPWRKRESKATGVGVAWLIL